MGNGERMGYDGGRRSDYEVHMAHEPSLGKDRENGTMTKINCSFREGMG